MSGEAVTQPVQPRGLSRIQAAAYIGVRTTKFDEMVAAGQMPRPKRAGRRVIWDRYALDEAFEALPDDGEAEEKNPWDDAA